MVIIDGKKFENIPFIVSELRQDRVHQHLSGSAPNISCELSRFVSQIQHYLCGFETTLSLN